MPWKEPKITKLYYSIGEVATKFNVSTSLIRFWEGEFDILKPKKNRKGNRLFTPKDIENLHLIYHLVKEKGYKLEGAKKILAQSKDEVTRKFEVISSLKNVRGFLSEMKDNLTA